MSTITNASRQQKLKGIIKFILFNIITSTILLLIVLLVGEVAARYLTSKPLNSYSVHKRYYKLLAQLPGELLPEKAQLIADQRSMGQLGGLNYHDYHLYSFREYRSRTINFTDFYNARHCPDACPEGQAEEIIWTFGGSTMQNLETTDQRSIANQIAVQLKTANINSAVRNFGVGSFQSSLELIKLQDLLRRVPQKHRPSIIVFYDGYNDAHHGYLFGAGNMQSDLSRKMELLIKKNHRELTQYAFAQWLARQSVLCRNFLSPHLMPDSIYEGIIRDGSDQNLNATVSIYLDNIKMLRAICQQFEITPLFVLQPLITSKQGLSEFEQQFLDRNEPQRIEFVRAFYLRVASAMAGSPDFVNLSRLLDNNQQTDFYDWGHTSPLTSEVIGKAIGNQVIKRARDANSKVMPASFTSVSERD